MDHGPSVDAIQKATDYGSWFWFIFITIVFFIILYGFLSLVNVAEISRNWPKYRCSPSVMPFASAFGHNTAENFNYCVQNIFKNQMGEATGPYNTILGSIATSMMEFLKNLNSLRIMMATLLGGITKVFQEFTDRFKLFMAQVHTSSLRLQMLMKRVFGTFYAMIYMGLSAVQVGQNFSQTFIFKFIDTFCFPPETEVLILNRGVIPIRYVILGDRFESGNIVTSVYKFMADGQPMVRIGSTEVSTNHFIQYNSEWIQAKDHPDAIPTISWNGGAKRPLICLDTTTHKIPISNEIFLDWDETSDSDSSVMKLVDTTLNGFAESTYAWKYQPALDGKLLVHLLDGRIKSLEMCKLGELTTTGMIHGLGRRLVQEICQLPSGLYCTPSQLLWTGSRWQRAGHIYPVIEKCMVLYTIVILHSSVLETSEGTFRDMIELVSPDTELPTKQVLNPTSVKDSEESYRLSSGWKAY